MSPVVRAGVLFGLAALLATIGAILILVVFPFNLLLAGIAAAALGWGAGYTAAKASGAGPGQGTGRGAAAGAIAGTIVLIGTVIAFVALTPFISSIPGFNEAFEQGLQQNPEAANLPEGSAATFLGLGLGVLGFCGGFINFLLMLIAGLIGGVMWKGAAAYVPAGGATYGAPATGGYVPNQTGSQTYGNQANEGGPRVYDPNEPNRPQ